MKKNLAFLLLLVSLQGFSQKTYYWVGGGSGAWSNSNNWYTVRGAYNPAGTAVLSGGGVGSVTLNNILSGYTTAPTVTLSGGTGTGGATATAVIDANGTVTGITVNNAGSYSAAPAVLISGGGTFRTAPNAADTLVIDGRSISIGTTQSSSTVNISFTDLSTETIAYLIITANDNNANVPTNVTFPSGTQTLTITNDLLISYRASLNDNGNTIKVGGAVSSGSFSANTTQIVGTHSGTGKLQLTGTSAISNSVISIARNTSNNGSGYATAPNVVVGTPWAVNTPYTAGTQIFSGSTNGGNLYTVVTGGTTGPLLPSTRIGGHIYSGTAVLRWVGFAAKATCAVSGGALSSLTVTYPGSGYTSAPSITFTGGTTTTTITIPATPTATVSSNTFFLVQSGNVQIDANASYGLCFSGNTTINGLLNLASGASLNFNSRGLVLGASASATLASTASFNNIGTSSFGSCPITLKSDGAGTASIGNITGALTASAVTVERYIPAKRAFRLLASPVTTTSFISNNWQLGTHITGPTTGVINGFDTTLSGNASMFTFDNALQNWPSIPNTNATNLIAGAGYRVLVRGNRTVNLTNNAATPTATTLSATGSLKVGDVVFDNASSVPLSNTVNNWSLIGNPYACAVDWKYLKTNNFLTNVGSYYYIWDPNVSNSGSKGAYTAYDATTDASTGGGAVNQYIQNGQSIFVQTTAASPVITFKEAAKNTTIANNNVSVYRNVEQEGRLKASLILAENATLGNAADALIVVYKTSFKEVYHVAKLMNGVDNLFIKTPTNKDAIQGRNLLIITDTIQLNITQLGASKYVLRVNTNNFGGQLIEGQIIDKYTKQQTALSIGGDTDVSFGTNNDTASTAIDRFVIVLNAKILVNPTSPTYNPFDLNVSNTANSFIVNYASMEEVNTSIRLINSNGQLIQSLSLGKQMRGQMILPTAQLSQGIYMLAVQMGKEVIVKKVEKF